MRIAYVVSLFPKISETFILREILGLRERGHDVRIISLKKDREPLCHKEAEALLAVTEYAGGVASLLAACMWWLLRRPVEVLSIAARIASSHAGNPLLLAKGLALIPLSLWAALRVKRLRVDHVHAHWASWPAESAWIISRLTRLPYSVTSHAHDLFLPNPMLKRKILDSRFFATISEYNRSFLIQSCGPEVLRKIRLIRCGLPLGVLPYMSRPPIPASGQPVRILSVGRLVDYKGFDILIKAVALLRARGVHVFCRIVGDGPERSHLEQLVQELNLAASVALVGGLLLEQVTTEMMASDLFVLACRTAGDGQQDGIPIVLMEAMALGVPVVSTRVSGIPELVQDSTTGLLAAPGDSAHLAQVMERVIAEPALAAHLRKAARAKIDAEYSIDKTLDLLCAEFAKSGEGSP